MVGRIGEGQNGSALPRSCRRQLVQLWQRASGANLSWHGYQAKSNLASLEIEPAEVIMLIECVCLPVLPNTTYYGPAESGLGTSPFDRWETIHDGASS